MKLGKIPQYKPLILLYFINFCFCNDLKTFLQKFWSHLDWFKIWKIQTWQWQKMEKSISQLPAADSLVCECMLRQK